MSTQQLLGSIGSEDIARLLLEEGCCSSIDEAAAVAEGIVEELEVSGDSIPITICLQDQLDLSETDAGVLASKLRRIGGLDDSESQNTEEDPDKSSNESFIEDEIEDEEEDGEALFDGECELCDRYIRLTKHHLIPKSTWPRLQTRLHHASEAIEEGDMNKALLVLGPGLSYLADELSSNRGDNKRNTIKHILHRTADICRPCHSTVHKAHENLDLALSYSTIELILADSQIAKYCKWANKQRPGRYAAR